MSVSDRCTDSSPEIRGISARTEEWLRRRGLRTAGAAPTGTGTGRICRAAHGRWQRYTTCTRCVPLTGASPPQGQTCGPRLSLLRVAPHALHQHRAGGLGQVGLLGLDHLVNDACAATWQISLHLFPAGRVHSERDATPRDLATQRTASRRRHRRGAAAGGRGACRPGVGRHGRGAGRGAGRDRARGAPYCIASSGVMKKSRSVSVCAPRRVTAVEPLHPHGVSGLFTACSELGRWDSSGRAHGPSSILSSGWPVASAM